MDELDTCLLTLKDGVVIATDECHEEVARFGVKGDCLNHFPGLAQDELDHCGKLIANNTALLEAGYALFFGFTPVSA